jgi:hypothetical protein
MTYLVHNIFKRVRAINSETNEEEVRLRIGQWTETVILFLSRCIPEGEFNSLASWWMCSHGNVILEDGRDVFLSLLAPMRTLKKRKDPCIPLGSVPQRS